MSSVESEALWRIYCSPGASGVAVKTNATRLWDATRNEKNANIGKVHYIDFTKYFAANDQWIYCKRSSLAHEREVRAVLPNDLENSLNGLSMPCDLNDLVEQVVISPYAPTWFKNWLVRQFPSSGIASPARRQESKKNHFIETLRRL